MTPQQEKPPQGEACEQQLESSHGSGQLEEDHMQQQRPSTAKNKQIINLKNRLKKFF